MSTTDWDERRDDEMDEGGGAGDLGSEVGDVPAAEEATEGDDEEEGGF